MIASTQERPPPVFPVENPQKLLERSTMLDGFRRRDADAVRAMYRDYGRLVYSVAHRALGRHDLAEEAVQLTFMNAWRAADRIDVDRDPAPWLTTIAKRVAIDIYRREACRPTTALLGVAPGHPAVVKHPPDADTLHTVWEVRRAIDALAPDEAAVVRLQHLGGMTQQEIADTLGIAVGTVKSRSHRAHQHLATLLEHLRDPSQG
jgi:RNA polymerase sigma factor (sigma-70 family)